MENTITVLNVVGPTLTILLTIINFYKSNKVEEMKRQTFKSQKRVEEIEKTIESVKEQIANNNRIAQITEIKEKTTHFQKIVLKYLKKPENYDGLGYSIESDSEDIQYFVDYLKQYSWLFADEGENYADVLYNELIPLTNAFEQGESYEVIHQQTKIIKSRIEVFKSKISKMHNDSMLL